MKGWENTRAFPEKVLKLMRPEDRRKLQAGNLTAVEALRKMEIKQEKDLQNQFVSYLGLKGIVVFWQRMDRKATDKAGRPDLMFAVRSNVWDGGDQRVRETFAVAVEVKLPGKELEPHQEKMRTEMRRDPNHWTHFVCRSLDELIEALRTVGINPEK